MLADNLDKDIADQVETEEERENWLDREESARKLKAIIFVVIPILIGFLTFIYCSTLEEKPRTCSAEWLTFFLIQ